MFFIDCNKSSVDLKQKVTLITLILWQNMEMKCGCQYF